MEAYTITAPVNTISGHKVPIGVNIPAGYDTECIFLLSVQVLYRYIETQLMLPIHTIMEMQRPLLKHLTVQLTFISSFIIGMSPP